MLYVRLYRKIASHGKGWSAGNTTLVTRYPPVREALAQTGWSQRDKNLYRQLSGGTVHIYSITKVVL